MKKKNIISIFLAAILIVSLLAGCVEGPAEVVESPAPEETTAVSGAVKTGLSISVDLSGSTSATAEEAGNAKSSITMVAVTVDEAGVIDDCVIDVLQGSVNFDTDGKITTPADTVFVGKNELGDNYGMKKASSIGKEWYEQAAAMAEYAKGKTVAEIKGIAMDETTKPTDADLASSVTISVGGFIAGIEAAVNNAQELGSQKGDELKLVSTANMAKSKDAAEGEGTAQTYATVAAVTMKDGVITGCLIDAVQANVTFDAKGVITGDLAAEVSTKNQLGDSYGMKKASSIGKEWHEQAAAFSAYVTGKTAAEVAGIAITDGKVADADLAASVTIGIGDFISLIEKAAK